MIQPVLFSFIAFYCYRTVAAFALGSTNVKECNETMNENLTSPMSMEAVRKNINSTYRPLVRVKRQNYGESKFAQAANMDQLKLFRLFLQNFKNTWDTSYIGGAHPLHANVPKAAVGMWKSKIMDFLFPPVGEDAIKGK